MKLIRKIHLPPNYEKIFHNWEAFKIPVETDMKKSILKNTTSFKASGW